MTFRIWFDLLLEVHVQQAICLIQHQVLELTQGKALHSQTRVLSQGSMLSGNQAMSCSAQLAVEARQSEHGQAWAFCPPGLHSTAQLPLQTQCPLPVLSRQMQWALELGPARTWCI